MAEKIKYKDNDTGVVYREFKSISQEDGFINVELDAYKWLESKACECAYVFVENDDSKKGYDHVYKVVCGLYNYKTDEYYEIGLLGMGDEIQIYNAKEYFKECQDFAIGIQEGR